MRLSIACTLFAHSLLVQHMFTQANMAAGSLVFKYGAWMPHYTSIYVRIGEILQVSQEIN